MKIFFSGAQGTGKSTLNKLFCEKHKDFRSLDSVSEKFAKDKDVFKDKDKLLRFQSEIALYCAGEYIKNDGNLISSRGFADMYAYNRYELENTNNYLEMDIFESFCNLAFQLQKAFLASAKIIYFPIMFDIEGKDLRSTDKEFQQQIDRYIQSFFKLTGVEYYTIKTLDKRLEEIEEYCFS